MNSDRDHFSADALGSFCHAIISKERVEFGSCHPIGSCSRLGELLRYIIQSMACVNISWVASNLNPYNGDSDCIGHAVII